MSVSFANASFDITSSDNNNNLVLSVPFGNDTLGLSGGDGEEIKAPESFYVTKDNEIYICDTVNSRVLVYKNGSQVAQIPVKPQYTLIDIYVDGKGNIYLIDSDHLDYNVLCIDPRGNTLDTFKIPHIAENISYKVSENNSETIWYSEPESVRTENGELIITFSNKKEFEVLKNKLVEINFYDYSVKLNKNKPTAENIKTKQKIDFDVEAETVEISAMKKDQQGRTFIKLFDTYQDQETKDIVDDITINIIDNNSISEVAELMNGNGFFRPNKDLLVTDDGNIYQMIVNEDSVKVYNIPVKSKKDHISKIKKYKDDIGRKNLNTVTSQLKDGISNLSSLFVMNVYAATTFKEVSKDFVWTEMKKWAEHPWTYNSSKNGDLSVVIEAEIKNTYNAALYSDYDNYDTFKSAVISKGKGYVDNNNSEWRLSSDTWYKVEDGYLTSYTGPFYPKTNVVQPGWLKNLNDGKDYKVIGIPYCWGGWHSTSFDSKISSGYFAGNIIGKKRDQYGKRISGFNNYHLNTAGQDCSGFVSVCFDLPDHYNTNGLRYGPGRDASNPDYANAPFKEIDWSKVQSYDILDGNGHVMIIKSTETDNGQIKKFYTYEAASTPGKVGPLEHTIDKIKGDGYKPYRYKNWKQEVKPVPQFKVLCDNNDITDNTQPIEVSNLPYAVKCINQTVNGSSYQWFIKPAGETQYAPFSKSSDADAKVWRSGVTSFKLVVNGSDSYVVEHSVNVILNETPQEFKNAKEVAFEADFQGTIRYPGEINYYKFNTKTNDKYTISSNGSIDLKCDLYDSKGQLIDSSDDINGDINKNFSISNTLSGGRTYYLKVRHYNKSQTGSYYLKIMPSSKVIPPKESDIKYVSAEYTTEPLVVGDPENLKVVLDNQGDDATPFIVELLFGRKSNVAPYTIKWYRKFMEKQTFVPGINSFDCPVTFSASGDLYTKVNVYDSEGKVLLLERIKTDADYVNGVFQITSMDYTTKPLEAGSNENLELKFSDTTITSAVNYYVLVQCGRQVVDGVDSLQWYNSYASNLIFQPGANTFEVPLKFSAGGALYTRVLVYDQQGGTKIYEKRKVDIDTVLAPSVVMDVVVSKVTVPQNVLAVQAVRDKTPNNACYDFDVKKKPYSGWVAIDYYNDTGKATSKDRVLRQAEISISLKDGNGNPLVGKTVSLTCSLGSNCFIKNPSPTNTIGIATGYIEFYGKPTFDVTLLADGVTKKISYTVSSATYKNIFYTTCYNSALYSRSVKSTRQGDLEQFMADINLEGSGKVDTVNCDSALTPYSWYSNCAVGTANSISRTVINYKGEKATVAIVKSSGPYTCSGLRATEGRSIAVDSPYITRRNYTNRSSYNSGTIYRGKVRIPFLTYGGYGSERYAEDSGGAINGYHIDIYIGTIDFTEFSRLYHPKSYETVTYVDTMEGDGYTK